MLQSVRHWQDVADQLTIQKWTDDIKTVCVKVRSQDGVKRSEYEDALQELVTQELLKLGRKVVETSAEADATLLIHTQVVSVKNRRFHSESTSLLYPLGAITGQIIGANSSFGTWAGVGYGIGAAAVIDALGQGWFTEDRNPVTVFGDLGYRIKNSFTGDMNGDSRSTRMEVLTTSELLQGGKIVSGAVHIAYIPSYASGQYYQQRPAVLRSTQG
jgi:hypothetical protein